LRLVSRNHKIMPLNHQSGEFGAGSAMFRSSSALASAYGIAVTGTMVGTAAMAIVHKDWRWPSGPRSR
jgi:hypothetical protein